MQRDQSAVIEQPISVKTQEILHITAIYRMVRCNCIFGLLTTKYYEIFQKRQYYPPPQNTKKKIENALQDAIINNNASQVQEIISKGM